MEHNLCNPCETVSHCRKHGCIPLTPMGCEPRVQEQAGRQLAALPHDVMRLIYAYGDSCEGQDGKSTDRFCDLVMAIRRLLPPAPTSQEKNHG